MIFKETMYKNLTDTIYYDDINVAGENITSLEGRPKKVLDGGFDCNTNRLKTLKYRPEVVEGDFNCHSGELISLEGRPKLVKGSFDCSENYLKNLIGSPEVIGGFFTCSLNNLETLEGRPKLIKGDFNCHRNKNLKNQKKEIIKQQIKAENYRTDEGFFNFKEIEIEFNEYTEYLKILEKNKKIKKIFKNTDYGLGF